jgi:hypothetical protein
MDGGALRDEIPETHDPVYGSKRLANPKPCRLRSILPEFAKIFNVDRMAGSLVPEMNAMLIVFKSQLSSLGVSLYQLCKRPESELLKLLRALGLIRAV